MEFFVLLLFIVIVWAIRARKEPILNIDNEIPVEFFRLKNVQLLKGNTIDFLSVGITGVWIIAEKKNGGNITFDRMALKIDGMLPESDFLKEVSDKARLVEDFLREKFNKYFPVQPIVVFTNPSAKINIGKDSINGVYVLHLKSLNKFILKSKIFFLESEEISVVFNAIEKFNINS